MEKNYYEILEIDKNASPEIIKKAYSTLAKKYHPDLQPEDKKGEAEEKFKIINEAYETLSNEEKKAEYDSMLLQNNVSKEDYESIYEENEKLKNIINNQKANSYSQPNVNDNPQSTVNNVNYQNNINQDYLNEYEDNLKRAYQKAYYDAYIQDLKNRGYKIRYKKTFKERIKGVFSLIITVFLLWVLWQIPFIREFVTNNSIFNSIFNMFSFK